MLRISDFAVSEIQQMMWLDILPEIAPQLTFLYPKIETITELDSQWIGIRCDHPGYPRGSWFDPPECYIFIKYRLGPRHQWLFAKNGHAWAIRRAHLLIRLLLKRLAREVAKEVLNS